MNGDEKSSSGYFPTVSISQLLSEHFFERNLLREGDRALIRSTCRRCGTVIVGSVMDGLADTEVSHVERCTSYK